MASCLYLLISLIHVFSEKKIETKSCQVAQAALNVPILLLQPPKSWDPR